MFFRGKYGKGCSIGGYAKNEICGTMHSGDNAIAANSANHWEGDH